MKKEYEYSLSNYRRKELRYFAMQYYDWEREYNEICYISSHDIHIYSGGQQRNADPTFRISERMIELNRKMTMVRNACMTAEPAIADYIFIGMTKGVSYDKMSITKFMPCSRAQYYKEMKRCFYRLHVSRK